MFQREFILRHLRPSVLIDQSLDSLRQTSRQILQLGNLAKLCQGSLQSLHRCLKIMRL